MIKRLIVITALLLSAHIATSTIQAQESCPTVLPARLTVGEQGRRLYDRANNLRNAPGLNGGRIGLLPPGARFTVVSGPECADGYVWWQVSYEALTGWTAEGDPTVGEYWLEPRGKIVMLPDFNGVDRAYAVALDGTMEREGCWQPPDDYTRVMVGYAELNGRTAAMLDHATLLYKAAGGSWNFRQALTQGSYNAGVVTASFGTHDAGGAVDIAVRSPVDWNVMWDEIPEMIDALRVAGFAAWLRTENQLYDGSVIHIHAIAVGDQELSDAARAQIDGKYGYLRGYNGLPPEYGGPGLDEHGGPILCKWMIAAGFSDLRPAAGR